MKNHAVCLPCVLFPDLEEFTPESISELNKDDKPLHLVMYTDGGSVDKSSRMGGAGVHGYLYLDEEVKTKSGAPKGYPTKNGYELKRSDKTKLVKILQFIDIAYSLPDKTNNYAELIASAIAMDIAIRLKVKSLLIISDSKYVLTNMEQHLDRWEEDDYISNGKEIVNREVWGFIQQLRWYFKRDDMKLKTQWVKGHDGNIGNELADSNATQAIYRGYNPLQPDPLYVKRRTIGVKLEEHSLHPLLSERRLILNTSHHDHGYYYQMSMGKRWANDEDERRAEIGKRISDTLISVVKLKESDVVIQSLEALAREHAKMDLIMVGRLDLLQQGTLYNEMYNDGVVDTRVNSNAICASSGIELINELSPARLSGRMIPVFEELGDKLTRFIDGDLVDFVTEDITNQIYTIAKDKKDNDVFTFNGVDDDSVLVVDFDTGKGHRDKLNLTCNVDIPSVLTFKRLAKHTPKVTLMTWVYDDSDRVCHYAIVIEIDGEVGIWMSAYANLHVYSRGRS